MKKFISRLLIASLCVSSVAAMADGARSFDRSSVHTGPKGTTTSSVHQEATATGYVRDRSTVNPSGKTASRHTEVDRNPDTGVVTRSVEGEKFNGKTYSRDSTRTPTENGFIKETTQITPNGKTREKLKVVERSRGTRSVDVTRINGRGQVSHRVTHSQRN
jgi:hypothetical protein